MATLCLRVSVAGSDAVKTMQFDPGLQVFDACRFIRDKVPESVEGAGKCQDQCAKNCVSNIRAESVDVDDDFMIAIVAMTTSIAKKKCLRARRLAMEFS